MKPSSRAERRANDALPTTSEGLQEPLERERRTPKEETLQELTSQLEQMTQERNNLWSKMKQDLQEKNKALREKADLAQQLEQALREKADLAQQLEQARLGETASL
jgi:DNA repair exonuclease SbcCD ATPase subunit